MSEDNVQNRKSTVKMPGVQCHKPDDVSKDSCRRKLFGKKPSLNTSTQPQAVLPTIVSSCTVPSTSLCVSKSTTSEGGITSLSPTLQTHSIQSVSHKSANNVSLENNNAIVNNVSLENNDATVESQLSENDDCLTVCASEKNDSTLTQNQLDPYGISTYLYVCTCCHSTVSRHLCVLFKVHNYDFNNYVVSQALSKDIRYKHHGTPEYVCKKCHHALRREKKSNILPFMPFNAVASPFKWKSPSFSNACDQITTHCQGGASLETGVHSNLVLSQLGTGVHADSNSTVTAQTFDCQDPTSVIEKSQSGMNTSEDVTESSFTVGDEFTGNVSSRIPNFNYLHVCTCCHNTFNRRLCVQFTEKKYDFTNSIVCDALSNDIRYVHSGMKEFICKNCHDFLRKNNPVMPNNAIASPMKGSFTCVICDHTHAKQKGCEFDSRLYNKDSSTVNNAFVKAMQNTHFNNKKFICTQCHYKLLGHSIVKCVQCSSNVKRFDTVLFDTKKYEQAVTPTMCCDETMYICKKCDDELMAYVVCMCCKRCLKQKSTILFKKDRYNFENDIVKELLSRHDENCSANKKLHICKTCHSNLQHKNDKEPTVPKVMLSKGKDKAAQKFLAAIDKKPEYVCTCCHRWLFRKSVSVFKEKQFNFDNYVVANALSEKYRYKMKQPTDASNVLQLSTEVSEYICATCKQCLCSKKPKLPAQAVANGLELSDIPEELANLNDLERRLISLRIPFMKILSMFRYGSHYKVDGPPVNVPATIDKICKILPRIPDEAEVYPMKLKRKLKYKGNYMYNAIRKDVVMNALRWLKNNNDYYKDVEMNDIWDEHWKNDELGSLLDANTDMEGSIIDESDISGSISFSSENETATEKIIRLQDEKEMKEDQLAADKNAEINGQPHSCTMQLEHIEDGVYSVAPGEDNLPKYVLLVL